MSDAAIPEPSGDEPRILEPVKLDFMMFEDDGVNFDFSPKSPRNDRSPAAQSEVLPGDPKDYATVPALTNSPPTLTIPTSIPSNSTLPPDVMYLDPEAGTEPVLVMSGGRAILLTDE